VRINFGCPDSAVIGLYSRSRARCSRNVLLICHVEVLHNTHLERVRLSGIDCPEKGQAFGTRAKQAASPLVFGRNVILQTHGQDKHRRTLADARLLDGTHVNHELVKNGWWWWYRKYAPGDTVLEGLEKEAREARKGL
jgi:endonuclease YncB( thermonuclease family)